jgi:hypothetical protein
MTTAPPSRRRRAPSHGGRREGAGRKSLDARGTAEVVAVRLTARHIARVERWMKRHHMETFSHALRAMIEIAPD